MKKIEYFDISEKKEFKRGNYDYKLVNADETNHIYLYKITETIEENGIVKTIDLKYELVRAVPYVNPDGSLVHIYPSTSDFGKYAYYIVGNEEYCKQRIQYRTECLKKCKFKLEQI